MATINDIADSIYNSEEVNQDEDVSVASITAWLKSENNLGDLNNLLHIQFVVDDTDLLIVDDEGNTIKDVAISILKELYLISFFIRKSKKFMGVGSVDQLLEVSDSGGTVRFLNRNEIAKNYIKLKNDSENKLKRLINSYKINAHTPQQVTGDDETVVSTSPRIGYRRMI